MAEQPATGDVLRAQLAAEFAERLDMLEESGQVTNLARRLTEMALAELAAELGLTPTEDDAAQFVTHLAIALTRVNRGDLEIVVSPVAVEEIAERHREREAITRVMRECSRLLQRDVPDAEIAYMTVHLAAMVDLHAESGA
jgi:transcriptional regulatory protein LevR